VCTWVWGVDVGVGVGRKERLQLFLVPKGNLLFDERLINYLIS